MDKNNQKKQEQLGMPIGTASNRLRKDIMFELLKRLELNFCFQCQEEITSIEELSIEHKVPWLDSEDPVKLFFDLDNIAFSHTQCNVGARRHKIAEHGTSRRYTNLGCRCDKCREIHRITQNKYRNKNSME